MRDLKRYGSLALIGATLALGACGGGQNSDANTTAGNTAAAGGEVSPGAVATPAAPAAGAGAMNNGAAGDLAGMSAPDVMALLGASYAAEITTSEAVVDKATNTQVKQYAREMIKMHRQMQGEADQLATRLNVTPGTPDMAQQKTERANQMAQQLTSQPKGEALDRQYVDGQVQMHQQTLTELQGLQNNTNVPAEAQQLVTKAIPHVQEHLQRAQRLQQQLGGAGATGGNSGGATGGTTGGAAGTTGAGATGGTGGTGGGSGM
jgi:putative membrane protein